MIISLNGWPGVGKLAVGMALKRRLGGRLPDNHTIQNVAIALTEFPTPAYYDTVRAVRDIAFARVLALPVSTPVILTNVLARGGPTSFSKDYWEAIVELAHNRGSRLLSVTLTCSSTEHVRRLTLPQRLLHRKIIDPVVVAEIQRTRQLFDDGAYARQELDNTGLSADQCAAVIADWAAGEMTALD